MTRKWNLILLIVVILLVGCGSEKDNVKENKGENHERQETETIDIDVEQEQTDWVANLIVAEETNQILAIAANGNTAYVSLHNKDEEGIWKEVLSTEASIGKNGVGKTKEGDGKTPVGIYHFLFGFGIKENPGTSHEYIKVDDSFYWVDDSNSQYYNQFVSTNNVVKDWESAEHIVSAGKSYNYVLAMDYNKECVPGLGSAIFMHCKPTGGAGCVAISEEIMIEMMKMIQPDCVIIIDDETNIYNY